MERLLRLVVPALLFACGALGALAGGVLARPASQAPPELVIGGGHRLAAVGAVFMPDGARVVSAGAEGTLRFWDAQTGELLDVLPIESRRPASLAVSPDGAWLAIGAEGATEVRHLPTGEVKQLPGATPLSWSGGVRFSPTGELLASARAGAVQLWETRTWTQVRSLPLGAAKDLAFDPAGRRLAAGSNDRGIIVWDVETGERLWGYEPPALRTVNCLSFSADGALLAGGGTSYLFVWDAATGEERRRLDLFAYRLDFGPRSNLLTTVSGGDLVQLWDVRTGELRREWWGQRPFRPTSMALSPDGRRVLVADEHRQRRVGVLRVWDPLSSTYLWEREGTSTAALGVAFSAAGRLLVDFDDGTRRAWNLRTLELERTEPREPAAGAGIRFYTNGRALIVRTGEQPSPLAEPRLARLLGPETRLVSSGAAVASPDGSLVAAGSSPFRNVELPGLPAGRRSAGDVLVWDTRRQRPRWLLEGHAAPDPALAFSPDGRTLLSAGRERQVLLWDLETGVLLARLPPHPAPVALAAFSPDGRRVVTADFDPREGRVQVTDISDPARPEVVRTFAVIGGGARSLRFSPDGGWLAVTTLEQRLLLWNGRPLAPLLTLEEVPGVPAFSPDGRLLAAAAGAAGAAGVRLWDLGTGGRPLGELLLLPADEEGEISREWLYRTPSGHYTGSPGVERHLRWRVGEELLPGEALRERFRRPLRILDPPAGR